MKFSLSHGNNPATKYLGFTAVTCKPSSTSTTNDSKEYDIIAACGNKSMIRMNSKGVLHGNPIALSFFVTSLSWQPPLREGHSGNQELLLSVGYSNGTLGFTKDISISSSFSLQKQKSIQEAHQGAITSIKWDRDGASLASGGADGTVKIWSKTGHLRSNLAAFSQAVHCLAWNQDGDFIAVAHGGAVSLIQTQLRGETLRLQVSQQEETTTTTTTTTSVENVLALDWSRGTDLIVCGGENCRYIIYDKEGHTLFTSELLSDPILSLTWSPNGDLFTVGYFGKILLSNQMGYVYTTQSTRNNSSSVIQATWSKEQSHLIATCCDGSTMRVDLVGKSTEWNIYSAEMIDNTSIYVSNHTSGATGAGTGTSNDCQNMDDKIEFPVSIQDFQMAFGRLVILTRTQCYIYQIPNIDSHVTCDIKDHISLIDVWNHNFATLCKDRITVYSHDGDIQATLPYGQGISREKLSSETVTISIDVMAMIDNHERKIIRLFHLSSKDNTTSMGQIVLDREVRMIKISQYARKRKEQRLLILDKSGNLSISRLQSYNKHKPEGTSSGTLIHKLGTYVNTFSWNDHCDSVAYLADSKLVVCYYPNAPFIDIDLLEKTKETQDASKYENISEIISFCGAQLTVRKQQDNCILYTNLNQDVSHLFQNAMVKKWRESLRLCRLLENSFLWSTVACLALQYEELETLELALSAMKLVDKMEKIRGIRLMKDGERKNAEMMMYKRGFDEAIAILLQANPPLIYRAVKMHVDLFQWDKALNIASNVLKASKDGYISLVLWYRASYLRSIQKTEQNTDFQMLFKKYGVLSQSHLSDLKRKLKSEENEN